MGNYRDLKVWKKSHHLVLAVYKATSEFPVEEAYGLTRQMRRCSTSIPSNIAEGSGRGGDTELARFLKIATGSATELSYQLLLARDLQMLSDADYDSLIHDLDEVQKMLTSLCQKLAPHQGSTRTTKD